MAEIDDAIERLEDMVRVFFGELCQDENSRHFPCYGFASVALGQVKARLRAPKGELGEYRDLLRRAYEADEAARGNGGGAFSAQLSGAIEAALFHDDIDEDPSPPTEAAAIRAALSRARGEGS